MRAAVKRQGFKLTDNRGCDINSDRSAQLICNIVNQMHLQTDGNKCILQSCKADTCKSILKYLLP